MFLHFERGFFVYRISPKLTSLRDDGVVEARCGASLAPTHYPMMLALAHCGYLVVVASFKMNVRGGVLPVSTGQLDFLELRLNW